MQCCRLEQLCTSSEYRQDVILVAGDVSDSLDTLEKTLQLLAAAFKAVFFVTGNHELWCRKQERGTYDSLGGYTSPWCANERHTVN